MRLAAVSLVSRALVSQDSFGFVPGDSLGPYLALQLGGDEIVCNLPRKGPLNIVRIIVELIVGDDEPAFAVLQIELTNTAGLKFTEAIAWDGPDVSGAWRAG